MRLWRVKGTSELFVVGIEDQPVTARIDFDKMEILPTNCGQKTPAIVDKISPIVSTDLSGNGGPE